MDPRSGAAAWASELGGSWTVSFLAGAIPSVYLNVLEPLRQLRDILTTMLPTIDHQQFPTEWRLSCV